VGVSSSLKEFVDDKTLGEIKMSKVQITSSIIRKNYEQFF